MSKSARFRCANGERAVALLLVLWGIAFLAGISILITLRVNEYMEEESLAEKMFRARQQALRGLAIGLHPGVKETDPLLSSGNVGDTDSEGYAVRVSDDAGRINPNTWVESGERGLFRTLFQSWGADLQQADAAIDSLIDWVDADDLRSLAGAEMGEYLRAGMEGLPRNAPLEDINEMTSILNLRDLLFEKEGWREYFTLWHDGKLNINHTDSELIAQLTGLSEFQIEAMERYLLGPDGIEGTEDDREFGSFDEVRLITGASGTQLQLLERFFDTSGSARRIESTGFSHGVSRTISVVANSSGQPVFWEER